MIFYMLNIHVIASKKYLYKNDSRMNATMCNRCNRTNNTLEIDSHNGHRFVPLACITDIVEK